MRPAQPCHPYNRARYYLLPVLGNRPLWLISPTVRTLWQGILTFISYRLIQFPSTIFLVPVFCYPSLLFLHQLLYLTVFLWLFFFSSNCFGARCHPIRLLQCHMLCEPVFETLFVNFFFCLASTESWKLIFKTLLVDRHIHRSRLQDSSGLDHLSATGRLLRSNPWASFVQLAQSPNSTSFGSAIFTLSYAVHITYYSTHIFLVIFWLVQIYYETKWLSNLSLSPRSRVAIVVLFHSS